MIYDPKYIYTYLTIPYIGNYIDIYIYNIAYSKSMIPKQNDIRPLCATAGTCSASKQCLEPDTAQPIFTGIKGREHMKDVNQKNGAVVLDQKNWDLQGFTRQTWVFKQQTLLFCQHKCC